MDGEAVRTWQGADIDLSAPLTSAAIVAAAAVDEHIGPHLAGYLAMTELPASLAPAEPLARAVYQSGWRPPLSDGPTRDQLIELLRSSATSRSSDADFVTDCHPAIRAALSPISGTQRAPRRTAETGRSLVVASAQSLCRVDSVVRRNLDLRDVDVGLTINRTGDQAGC